jgi:hypothetical protein
MLLEGMTSLADPRPDHGLLDRCDTEEVAPPVAPDAGRRV